MPRQVQLRNRSGNGPPTGGGAPGKSGGLEYSEAAITAATCGSGAAGTSHKCRVETANRKPGGSAHAEAPGIDGRVEDAARRVGKKGSAGEKTNIDNTASRCEENE